MARVVAFATASSALLGAGVLAKSSTFSNTSWLQQLSPAKTGLFTRPAFAESNSSRSTIKPTATSRIINQLEVAEPSTGIQFSTLVKFPGASSDLKLLGVGVREKKIAFISVKVYAVGFYSNEEQLSQEASEKGLSIKLARDIDGALFCSALDEELKPRMKGGEQTLVEFGNTFKDRSLKKGTGIYFTWTHPDTLHVGISQDGSVPSSPTATLQSALLPSALFDVYLGEKSVSPSLKSSLKETVQQSR